MPDFLKEIDMSELTEYKCFKQFEKHLQYFEEALKIANGCIEYSGRMANLLLPASEHLTDCHSELASSFAGLKDYIKVRSKLQDALGTLEKSFDENSDETGKLNIPIDEAKKQLENKEGTIDNLSGSYQGLAKAYREIFVVDLN